MTSPNDVHVRVSTLPVRGAALAMALMISLLTIVGAAMTAPPAGAAAGGQASRYVAISPIRVLNTRDPGFGPLLSLGILSVDPLVPAVVKAAGVARLDIEAVAINLTIAGPSSFGYLKSWPTAEPTPPRESASAVNNRSAGEDIANFSIVPVGANGRISIQTLNTTDVIVDVQGVFVRSSSSRAGRFVPIATPQRALDTRQTTPVKGKTAIVVDLAGLVDEIPRTASAAVINLVATRTQEAGFLTAFPKGKRPNASNVNYPAGGHDIAGSTITQLDNGKFTIYANGTTDVIVDVLGYMTGESDADSASGLFVAFEPERHYDSRANKAPFGSAPLNGSSYTLQVAGKRSVPMNGVLAVASNLTMTGTDGSGNLVAYPKSPRPANYSTVNAVFVQHTVANHAIVALDNGGFSIYSPRRADFIVDISGYFLDGTTTPPTTARRVDTDPTPTPDVDQAPVSEPPFDNDFAYLQEAAADASFPDNDNRAAYTRGGNEYYGWNPCKPITYAVNAQRSTPAQMAALNAAIYDVEMASGFDLQYLGKAAGSMNTDSVDPRVVGGGEAMAVFGFSNTYETPMLSGGTIGIGGLGSGIDSRTAVEYRPGDSFAWIVRDGFAFADITDLDSAQEIRATFAHEIGHMIGLDHVSPRDELMAPVLTNRFTFGNGDKYGLWSIGADPCAAKQLSKNAFPVEPIGIDVIGLVAD